MELDVIHTGQHYDYELSQVFINEFGLPEPTANLNVGSGSHAYQTGEIMLRLEKYLLESKPSIVLIPGDTNSALAGALTAVKLGFPIAHIKAGARCYDMRMAEEINRRLVDHCSKLLFAPTRNCEINLKKESVLGEIYLTGDTMYDVFLRFNSYADKSDILDSARAKHAYAFVHARAKIYLANGFNIQVFVPSRTSLHNYCYEGVSIYKARALQGGGTKNPSLSSVYVGRITGKELAYRNTDGLVKLFNTGDLGSLFIMGERELFSYPPIHSIGFFPHMEMIKRLTNFHVGLIPWVPHPFHYFCSPNKAFQYAHAGLALILPKSMEPVANMLRDSCIVFGSFKELVELLKYYKENIAEVIEIGIKTAEYARKMLRWEMCENQLVNAYTSALQR